MTSNSIKGYFNASAVEYSTLLSQTKECDMTFDAPEGKDTMTLLLVISSDDPSQHTLICYGNDGFPDRNVPLTDGTVNAIRIPSLGYVNGEGKVRFKFISGNGSVAAVCVSGYLINHIDAVNN